MRNNTYIVGDDDSLVVVDDLLVVGEGGVPTVGVAEGDGVAGPGVDVRLDSGDHLVIPTLKYT